MSLSSTVSGRLRDIGRKSPILKPTLPVFGAHVGVRRLYGVVSVTVRLAVFIEHRLVTDGQSEDRSIYRASRATYGKNSSPSRDND